MREAERVCASVPEAYRAHAVELFDQLAFMKSRLEDARKHMDGMALVLTYEDSRGQTRAKANPAFETYNALMGTYRRTLSEFREIVGSGAQGSATVLKFERFAKTMKRAADA